MKKIFLILIYFLQLVLLGLPFLLEKLSEEKLGIRQYIVAENKDLSQGLLTTANIRTYMAFFAILTIASLLYLISQRNKLNKYNKVSLIVTIIFNSIFMFIITCLNVKKLLVFYFVVLASVFFTLLQYIKIAFLKNKHE